MLSGAALVYLVTVLTFLPLFWDGLIGLNGVRAVDGEATIYGAAMALAGALPGGCGLFLHGRLRGVRPLPASGPRHRADASRENE